MRFVFIDAEKAHYPIRLLCRVLQVSRSGYYAWCSRGPSVRAQADEVLVREIRTEHARSRGTYGAPRMQAALRASGRRVGRRRVARLMRCAGLVGVTRRRYRCTTNSQHDHGVLSVLTKIEVARRFSSHGLRRTANDLLRRVASGEVTRAITGHATVAMTDRYSFVDLAEKKAAASNMLRLVHGSTVDPGESDKS